MTRLEYFLNRNVDRLIGLLSLALGFLSAFIIFLCLLMKGS